MYCHHPNCHHPSIDPATAAQKLNRLWWALGLILVLAAAEFSVGWLSGSLSLRAEAGHMLSDGLALGLSLLAVWLARLPASAQAPFGYRRVEILTAFVNGVGLLTIAVLIAKEAIDHLLAPPGEILSVPMLITAVIGFGINSLNALLLHHNSQDDLNLRGAFLHMVADAVSSVGVVLAALMVWIWGWNWADGAISLGVAVLVGLGALPLIRQSLHILLEKAPVGLDLDQLQAHLASFDGVAAVQDLRVWSIALNHRVLSAQLTVSLKEGEKRDRLLRQIQDSLRQNYGIWDSFLQMSAAPVVSLSFPERLELAIVPVVEG